MKINLNSKVLFVYKVEGRRNVRQIDVGLNTKYAFN
jgi:hypothetical protein